MLAYRNIVEQVLCQGAHSNDRTGVGTVRLTGAMFTHDMRQGFPAITLKRLAWRACVGELLWFIRGEANVEALRRITYGANSTKRTIWDDNYEHQAVDLGYRDGYLGPVYGRQWRGGILDLDQLEDAVEKILHNPTSRRIMVNSWNVNELHRMALPPCHFNFQFLPQEDGSLDLVWSQRSCDVFLGLPFNIASYALLLSIVATITGRTAGKLVGMLADVHIYKNHISQCKEMLQRDCKVSPSIMHPSFRSLAEAENAKVEDFQLIGYEPHPTIKGAMAI